MGDKRVGILGLGAYLPQKVLTNFDLEKMVNTSDEWIRTRTGINSRHIAPPELATSDLAVFAAGIAIKNAGIKKEDIGLIIVATITPDMIMPSTSCIVQAKLDIKEAACYDINAACSGFIFAVSTASDYIKNNPSRYALVIGAEIISRFVDWQDRSTCVLFGDGAGACVLGMVREGGLLSTYMGSDGTFADLLKIPAGGSKLPTTHKTLDNKLGFLKMEGNEVFKIAVRAMVDSVNKALLKANLTEKNVDCVIPHQANLRIIEAVLKKLGFSKDRAFLNIDRCGNMSAASTPVALYEAVSTGKIKRGDIVVLVAFGGGLTWGALVLRW
ncbi:MAG: ketoacyl-ACP synthase III [Candidatus Omnitrophica bacterium]|nr:ketoacyl-ACP synthase III [Candidatus Omnitrophota bacterium]